MSKNIPKYVQVLSKSDPKKEEKEHLIKAYNLDGVVVDVDMLKLNPNAKQKIVCITATPPSVQFSGSAEFNARDEKMGYWIYCGNEWYVRKLKKEYEFSKYMAYNTKEKKIEGIWDDSKFSSN